MKHEILKRLPPPSSEKFPNRMDYDASNTKKLFEHRSSAFLCTYITHTRLLYADGLSGIFLFPSRLCVRPLQTPRDVLRQQGRHTHKRKSEAHTTHTYICVYSGALTVYIYNVLSLFMCVYAYVVKNIRDNKGNKPPLGIIKRW